MKEWLQSIPNEYFLIGDNAYPLSNNLLIPYWQAALLMVGGEYKRTYNFYLSQLRINIEMAFGRLTNKWRIFHKDLQTALPRTKDIVMCFARLHNYIIDTEGDKNATFEDNSTIPVCHTTNEGDSDFHHSNSPNDRRNNILHAIQADGVARPVTNIVQNG